MRLFWENRQCPPISYINKHCSRIHYKEDPMRNYVIFPINLSTLRELPISGHPKLEDFLEGAAFFIPKPGSNLCVSKGMLHQTILKSRWSLVHCWHTFDTFHILFMWKNRSFNQCLPTLTSYNLQLTVLLHRPRSLLHSPAQSHGNITHLPSLALGRGLCKTLSWGGWRTSRLWLRLGCWDRPPTESPSLQDPASQQSATTGIRLTNIKHQQLLYLWKETYESLAWADIPKLNNDLTIFEKGGSWGETMPKRRTKVPCPSKVPLS